MATDTVTDDADTVTDTVTMVTLGEAARLVGVSVRTIRRWIQHGHLPCVEAEGGKVVSPADLPEARRRAGHGHGHGHRPDGHREGYGHAPGDMARDTATPDVAVSARDQLAAIWEQWLAPLTLRVEELARENGELRAARAAVAEERDRLRAEREVDRRLAGQLVDLLQVERDALRAEVERLRTGADAVVTRSAPAHGAEQPAPAFRPSVPAWRERTTRAVDLDQPSGSAPWWRFWERWR